jgi:hypothetical protein
VTNIVTSARRAIVNAANGKISLKKIEAAIAKERSVTELRKVSQTVSLAASAGDELVKRVAKKILKLSENKIDTLIEDPNWDGDVDDERRKIVDHFIEFAAKKLKIDELPDIEISDDKAEAKKMRSLGYMMRSGKIWVYFGERFLPDVLRTLGHELVHWRQHEEDRLGEDAGKDGSEEENEANSKAAVMMREYGRDNPKIFEGRLDSIRLLFI